MCVGLAKEFMIAQEETKFMPTRGGVWERHSYLRDSPHLVEIEYDTASYLTVVMRVSGNEGVTTQHAYLGPTKSRQKLGGKKLTNFSPSDVLFPRYVLSNRISPQRHML